MSSNLSVIAFDVGQSRLQWEIECCCSHPYSAPSGSLSVRDCRTFVNVVRTNFDVGQMGHLAGRDLLVDRRQAAGRDPDPAGRWKVRRLLNSTAMSY